MSIDILQTTADEESAPREPQRGSSTRALVVLAIALFASVCLFATGISVVASGPDLQAAREDATQAAVPAVEEVFSGPMDRDAVVDRAAGRLSERLREQVRTGTAAGSGGGSVEPTLTVVREAAPVACGSSCSAHTVDVLVFADQSGTAKGAEVMPVRIVAHMVHEDGEWVADAFTTL